MCFLDKRCLLLCFLLGFLSVHSLSDIFRRELLHLLAIVLVESHIVVADEVVALLAAGLGGFTIAVFEPCKHRLADMYATVVDNIGLDHLVAVGLHNLGKRPSQQVVAHMPEVKGFVCIWRRILYHYQWRVFISLPFAILCVGIYVGKQLKPCRLGNHEIKESLHHIERCYCTAVVLQILSYLLSSVLGFLLGNFEEREHYECEITLKLLLCLLYLHHFGCHLLTI